MDKDLKFEAEVIKNYFIVNGGFSGISENESRLYNYLAQLKYHNRFKDFGINLDINAPGGMNTVLFRVMGYSPTTPLKVEPYAFHLGELKRNIVKMSNREKKDLKEFTEYYGYGDDIDKFIEDMEVELYPRYDYNDVWLSMTIYSMVKNSSRMKKYQAIVAEILKKDGSSDVLRIIIENMSEIENKLKELLPRIEVVDIGTPALITEVVIQIPKNIQILWSDIILMLSLGFSYRGLYKPTLQLGVKFYHLLTNNVMFLDANILIRDEIYRRKFKFPSLPTFWGIEGKYPQLTYDTGYVIYPIVDTGQITGREGYTDVYVIWKEGYNLFTDEKTLPIIYPHLHRLTLTDNYYSEKIGVSEGYLVPCIATDDGTVIPIVEYLFHTVPSNNDFYNLTAYNVGIYD